MKYLKRVLYESFFIRLYCVRRVWQTPTLGGILMAAILDGTVLKSSVGVRAFAPSLFNFGYWICAPPCAWALSNKCNLLLSMIQPVPSDVARPVDHRTSRRCLTIPVTTRPATVLRGSEMRNFTCRRFFFTGADSLPHDNNSTTWVLFSVVIQKI